jgi:hypothetical protein
VPESSGRYATIAQLLDAGKSNRNGNPSPDDQVVRRQRIVLTLVLVFAAAVVRLAINFSYAYRPAPTPWFTPCNQNMVELRCGCGPFPSVGPASL